MSPVFISDSPCKNGYQNLIEGSRYCFKKLTMKLKWEKAREECEKDVGDLNTYNNANEAAIISNFVSQSFSTFWLGYRFMFDGRNSST